VGSAGKQPTRDTLMTGEKVKRKGFKNRTPYTFSEVFIPSKTHQ